MRDVEFVKEYPPNEPSGIDIVGLKEILGKKIEIIAIEVLGIAEETVMKKGLIRAGQMGKIMTDISNIVMLDSKSVASIVMEAPHLPQFV